MGQGFPFPVGRSGEQQTFESKWRILVDFEHCFCCMMHMQHIGILRYMLGSGVCLSVTRSQSGVLSMQLNAINRKLKQTLYYHITGPMTSVYSDVTIQGVPPMFFSSFLCKFYEWQQITVESLDPQLPSSGLATTKYTKWASSIHPLINFKLLIVDKNN